MSEAKQELLKLQETERYVFHGTHKDLTEFRPQQAFNYDGVNQTADGTPAVFASGYVEYAIFMAIITEENCPAGYWSGAGTTDGVLKFNATQQTLDQLEDTASGWVYVFERKDFEKRDDVGLEFVTYEAVTPVQRIQVAREDLPSEIAIRE
ncbi:MAG: hypothetical protein WDZ93_03255 [Candidatus Paceibacterota bacterium]